MMLLNVKTKFPQLSNIISQMKKRKNMRLGSTELKITLSYRLAS